MQASYGFPCPSTPPQAAEALSTAVLATAKEMEHKPAGCADFFEALKVHMASLPTHSSGRFRLRENTNEYAAAARR